MQHSRWGLTRAEQRGRFILIANGKSSKGSINCSGLTTQHF